MEGTSNGDLEDVCLECRRKGTFIVSHPWTYYSLTK